MIKTKEGLIKEKEMLLNEIIELGKFIASESIDNLSEATELLVKKQIIVMNDYLNILIIRIELAKDYN